MRLNRLKPFGAALFADNEYRDINVIRDKVASMIIGFYVALGLPITLLSLYRATVTGWQPLLWWHIGFYLIVLCAFFTRNITPPAFRMVLVTTLHLMLGFGGLITWGLIGHGEYWFMIAILLAALFFGLKPGLILAGINLVGLSAIAFFICTNRAPLTFDIRAYAHAPVSWITAILVLNVFTLAVLFAWRYFYEAIISANRSLAQKSDQLNQANRLLEEEIEERKQTERALRESEEKYRLLIESAKEGIVLVRDGRILYCNPLARKLVGRTQKEVEGKTFQTFIHPEDREKLTDLYQKKIRGEHVPTGNTYRITKKDGRFKWVRSSSTLLTVDQKPTILTFLSDITELTEKTDALKKSEEKYRHIFENVSDFLYVHDLTGRFVETNFAFKNTYGYTDNELAAMNVQDLMPDEYKAQFADYLQRVKANGHDEGLLSIETKNGEHLVIEYRNVLVRDPENQGLLVQGSGRDITDKLKTLKEKEALETQLRQAYKMEAVGTMAGGIAHDFNNILAAVIGHTELALEDTPAESPVHASLKDIYKAGVRARDLVKQILAFSHQNGREMISVALKPIVQEALKLIRASLPATIEIRSTLASDAHILADPTQIHQILMNLCTNAGHAMEEDGGLLEIVLEEEELTPDFFKAYPGLAPGRYLRLAISDTGQGIAPELIDRIFVPYFTTKARNKGTGMGLSVVHGIVRTHGGIIKVDSHLGEGSVFTTYLPVCPIEAVKEPQLDVSLVKGTERIMVIDDETPILALARKLLTRLGYQVVTHSSSVDAVEAFRRDPQLCDLVITDMTMPRVTGDRVTEELLKIRPDLPVIICTGYSERITPQRAVALGAKGLLYKPIMKEDMARMVRQVLDKHPPKAGGLLNQST